ncbi:MAG: amidohydrolase, partial [Candidatus Cloacimonadota bacterium]
SHTHLLQEGLNMTRPALSNAKSPEELLEMVRSAVKQYDRGKVIIASDFDESRWKENQIPEKETLDSVAPTHPLIIRRICGHIAVANTEALKRIPDTWKGVDRKTGIMKEDVPLNLSRIFPPDENKVREGLKKAIKKANSLGITSIHEIVKLQSAKFYEELSDDELTLNVQLYIPVNDLGGVRQPNFQFTRIRFGGVKIFADGSIGARTAANTFAYRDDPDNKGKLMYSEQTLEKFVKDAEESGIQLMIHAIGNRAIRQVLDAFCKYVKKGNPCRHRIEHCELIDECDIRQIEKLGIVVSMQPNFIFLWSQHGGMYERVLGKRYRTNNPVALLKNRDIIVAFGSDSMPLSPLLGIEGTVNAPFDCQRMRMEEAIACYTKNSAIAGFSFDNEGEIKEGKDANFVVFDQESKKVCQTFYRGCCVFTV